MNGVPVPDHRLLARLRWCRDYLRAQLARGSRADRAGAELALQAVGVAISDVQRRRST